MQEKFKIFCSERTDLCLKGTKSQNLLVLHILVLLFLVQLYFHLPLQPVLFYLALFSMSALSVIIQNAGYR
jgi:Kef-type K+ transport system membrane component KefB